MEQAFEAMLEQAAATPHMIHVSIAIAVVFLVLGVILTAKKDIVKGHRWPGITCMLLGFASIVTNAIQYFGL